jgi:hypothetical protein
VPADDAFDRADVDGGNVNSEGFHHHAELAKRVISAASDELVDLDAGRRIVRNCLAHQRRL